MSDALTACRRAYAAYSAGDLEQLMELFDRHVEVVVAPPNFEAGTYRGHGEYQALLARWGSAWDEMHIEPRELRAEGDWVLALVDYRGRGTGSAVEVSQPSWEVSLWQDGRCVRYEVYWDQEAGEAAFARRAADSAQRQD